MRDALLLAALAALSGPAGAQPMPPEPLTLTMEQAIDLALKENIDVALAELDLRFFQSRYRQVLGAAVPDLTLSGSYTRNVKKPVAFFGGGKVPVGELNGMQASVGLEQTLYSGGKLRAGLQATKLGVSAGEDSLRAARDETTFAVRRLFYSVLLASVTASIQQDNLASAEEHLRTIQARYKDGVDSDLTVLRQEVEVAGAKPALISARNLLEVGLTLLKDVLKMDVDRPLVLSGELASPGGARPDYEAVVRAALERRPELQAVRKRAAIARAHVRVAAGDMKPHLSIFADYRWQAQSADLSPGPHQRADSAAGGLRLDFPFFTGGEDLERVRQARVEYEKARELEAKAERAVRAELKQDWLAALEARERAQSQETAIAQARKAWEATELRYKAGRVGQLDLTDATLALNRVRTIHAQALSDYWTSMAALEKAAGVPLKEIAP